jgi:hypothetical protein
MDLGAYQLQIFLSLFVVLGAAFVALVCDLLKSNNQHLRELNIELSARNKEQTRRYEMLLLSQTQAQEQMKQDALAAAVEVGVVAEAVGAERGGRPPRAERKRAPAQEALAAMERGAQMAALPRRGPQPAESVPAAIAAYTELKRPPALFTASVHEPELVVEYVVESVLSRAAEIPAAATSFAPLPSSPAAMSTRDWSSMLNRRATPTEAAQPVTSTSVLNVLLEAVVAATDSTAPATVSSTPLPAGFQDGFVLTRLVERRQPISGLVVSIGLAEEKDPNAESNSATQAVPAPVRALIESMIGPRDFAAQSGMEEYLLIYPGVRGAAAQRKLSEVAKQLWDFQRLSMGQFLVQFGWGGVEVRSESIEEAIASATERMNETRRGRKVVAMDSDVLAALPKAG